MRYNDRGDIEQTLNLIFPEEEARKECLTMFLDSIDKANTFGANKWGVHYRENRIRLLVGFFIVFAIQEGVCQEGSIWLALDKESMSKAEYDFLSCLEDWHWDTVEYPEYKRVPSRNGYYHISEKHSEIWPLIKKFHFNFIENVCRRFGNLRKASQSKHSSAVLDYLSEQLGHPVPRSVYGDDFTFAEELMGDKDLYEGVKQQVTVNAYERNPKARQKCIERYGPDCLICGFNFAKRYGNIGKGFIHVHHLKPISEIGKEYQVSPVRDLCPVFPNCHAIIHRRNPPYSIEEVKGMLGRV